MTLRYESDFTLAEKVDEAAAAAVGSYVPPGSIAASYHAIRLLPTTSTRGEPRIRMNASHPMSVPTGRRRRPVFVRSTCFRRAASQADGRPGIAGGYIGAPAAGAPPAPADRALPQFTQNIVPGVFAAPQRGHVTLVANRPPPPGNLDRG